MKQPDIEKLPKWAQELFRKQQHELALSRAFCWPTTPRPIPYTRDEIAKDSTYDKPMPGWYAHSYNDTFRVTLGCSTISFHNSDGPKTNSQNMGLMYRSKSDALCAARWDMCERFAKALCRLDVEAANQESL